MTVSDNGIPAVEWEDRDWRWEDHGPRPANRADRQFRHYRSAIPAPLAKVRITLEAGTALAIEAAATEVAHLDAVATFDLTALGGALLRSESVASSKIEHLAASHRDVAGTLIGASPYRGVAGLVARNVEAMSYAVGTTSSVPSLSVALILEIHRRLLSDDEHDREWIGKVREHQNWLGGSDDTPRGALFVPPRPELVSPLLDDLVRFADRDDLPILAQAAIVHAQFETIHPFVDGNGRTGRALVHVLMRRRATPRCAVVPVSTVLLADTDSYFDGLDHYRSGRLDDWIVHFARATTVAAQRGAALADDLRALRAEWHDDVHPRQGSAPELLLDALVQQPVVDIDSARTTLPGTTDANIYKAIERLEAAGALEQISKGARNRVWAAPAVLALLEEFERSVRRRRSRVL
jgi:Fic family protein